jgi:rod shape determining protein RodA
MKTFSKMHPGLLIVPFMIFVIGFVTHYSTSPERGTMHLFFFLFGLFLYFIMMSLDYSVFLYIWKYIYIIVLVLLFVTFILGEVRLGASRWLTIGMLTFQPSELSKLVLTISIGSYIYSLNYMIFELKNVMKLVLYTLPLLILVFIQPDLGTTLILLVTFTGILFYSGVSKMYFLLTALFFGILSEPLWSILKDYQKNRILVFLNPQLDTQGSGYNVIQSLIAIGSGGIFGQGFSRGTQTHLNFLPAYWTDFVFASFSEEWGLIGVSVLLILFLILFMIILYMLYKTRDVYAKLLIFGIFTTLLIQFVINIGMNLGLLPVTGIPLPLMSYGGSSMLVTMLMLGMLQSTWVHRSDSI